MRRRSGISGRGAGFPALYGLPRRPVPGYQHHQERHQGADGSV